jgi:hypothetical protein
MTKEIQDLTPDERRAILDQARRRQAREFEDELIARELARQAAEAEQEERKAS